ncbi:MAG: 30S ribosomal protein S1 [Lentisphaeria bacterium]
MSELLGDNQEKSEVFAFAPGSIVTGKVTRKVDNGALVDIGYKSEGMIPREEFDDFSSLEEGSEIEVFVESLEDEEAEMPLLSVRKAQLQKAWDDIQDKYHEGEITTGKITRRVRGGLIVDIGVEAFLPGSQIDITPVRNLDDLIGSEERVKILNINPERRNIVVSRRDLIAEERERQRSELLNELEVGQTRTGTVKNITDFGAFIDLQGIDGLLHITDMSWGRISHPSEMLAVGDEVEVVILDIDEEKQRVSLGMKQREGDPWDNIEEKYPEGKIIQGRVVNVMPYGGFVELEEGVEGLIHVSEMSWTKKINKASEVLNVGDEVEAVVMKVDKESRKISLSLRRTTENPWEALAEKFPPGSRIKGKVRNMTTFGAFVQIDEDIDGMIHVSDMSWTRKVRHPSEVLEKDQEVEAVVLDIDPEKQRVSLGLKQLIDDPWAHIEEHFAVGDSVRGTIIKVTPYGAFVRLQNDIEGLLHISELQEEYVEDVKEMLQEGQEIDAKVVSIDSQERRIGLSLKEDYSSPHASDDIVLKNIERGGEMVTVGDAFKSMDEAAEAKEQAQTASTDAEDEGEEIGEAAEPSSGEEQDAGGNTAEQQEESPDDSPESEEKENTGEDVKTGVSEAETSSDKDSGSEDDESPTGLSAPDEEATNEDEDESENT